MRGEWMKGKSREESGVDEDSHTHTCTYRRKKRKKKMEE